MLAAGTYCSTDIRPGSAEAGDFFRFCLYKIKKAWYNTGDIVKGGDKR